MTEVDAYLYHKYSTLKVMIYSSLCVCGFFSIINFTQGRTFLAFVDIIICILNLLCLLNFQTIIQSKYKESFIVSYSVILMIVLIVLFWGGTVEKLSYIWLLIIPFLGYMVNGLNNGFRLTAFFTLISLSIYVYNTQIQAESINPIQMFNVFCGMIDIWALTHFYEKTRLNVTDKLVELTTIDSLTKLKTRTEFYNIYRFYKDMTVSLILLDVDDLKTINEQHGHLAGDVALMSIANILTEFKSQTVQVFRIGSDEFALLIANKSCDDCLMMTRQIYEKICHNKPVLKTEPISINISMALTSILSDGNNLDQLMAKADDLIKKAKLSETDKISVH